MINKVECERKYVIGYSNNNLVSTQVFVTLKEVMQEIEKIPIENICIYQLSEVKHN